MAARAESTTAPDVLADRGNRGTPTERSEVLRGTTQLVETPHGPILVTVNEFRPGEPAEVFVRAGTTGSELAGTAEAIGRLCSLCLRLPSPTPGAVRLALIADELAGIGGRVDAGVARSLPDAVARALADASAGRQQAT
jgi:ribonucleoside-diphosphate reductase alpha chain